jgi:salicylate hydroxylase
MRIAIVGGGIGGAAAALMLLRSGFDVQVYEQAPESREVGAGVQISPNATRILLRLGLGSALARVGVRPGEFQFNRWDNGNVLASRKLGLDAEAEFGAPYYTVHRADLLKTIVDAIPPGIINFSHQLTELIESDDSIELIWANGGRTKADIVIGCDGIRSQVRTAIWGPEEARFSGTVVYRGLLDAKSVEHLNVPTNVVAWLGPGAHLVHYFISAGRYLNVGAVIDQTEWVGETWQEPADALAAQASLQGWHEQAIGVVNQLSTVTRWGIFHREPLKKWSKGRVTLLGDASHAMVPFMAQGAAQAIEDAAVLALCLKGATKADVPERLNKYEDIRKNRTGLIQNTAKWNGRIYHLPDGEQQRERDAQLASGSVGPLAAMTALYSHDAETLPA